MFELPQEDAEGGLQAELAEHVVVWKPTAVRSRAHVVSEGNEGSI